MKYSLKVRHDLAWKNSMKYLQKKVSRTIL